MDLNELLHAQQIALMKADLALDAADRAEWLSEVASHAESIVALSQHWVQKPAGTAKVPGDTVTWENEGGALAERGEAQQIEISMIAQYRVGPYRYDTLANAIAQQRRLANGRSGSQALAMALGVRR